MLRRYRCHKIVKAGKIKDFPLIIQTVGVGELINYSQTIEVLPHEFIEVPAGWMAEHKPEIGGYIVEYEDGYISYSPAKAFEEGYTLID